MTTVFSPSVATPSTLTTASMQTSPGVFLIAYHIPACSMLKTKPNQKKTTTITSIFGSRSVIDYFALLKNHRPDPKQMVEGSNRPFGLSKLVYVGCVLDHVAICMIASLGGYVNVKLSHKFIFVEDAELI